MPKEIKKQLRISMEKIGKLQRDGTNDKDIVFRLTRIIAQIWQIHPFREGNTRSVIVFVVLFAHALGFSVKPELFKLHNAYLRNALVWASQGIYSKHEYLEHIFFDIMLGGEEGSKGDVSSQRKKYEIIEGFKVKDYKERPHEYLDEE